MCQEGEGGRDQEGERATKRTCLSQINLLRIHDDIADVIHVSRSYDGKFFVSKPFMIIVQLKEATR